MGIERGSVELVDVTKRYGDITAVDKINLEIHAGEFLSLLGPSGCGKTTTLRMLAGFEQPDEGFIRISGEYVQGVPPHKRDVNTVFQHYALFPHMTVAENVAYGLRQKGVNKSDIATRVHEALGMVQMTKLADRRPRQMSGGQQQRVAIIRALAMQPEVLLLDEITSALDPELVGEVLDVVRELKGSGITLLIATHEMAFAREISDRVCFLHAGSVAEIGTPSQVFGAPRDERTQQFLRRVRSS